GTIFPEDLYRYDTSGNRNFSTTEPAGGVWFSYDATTLLSRFNNANNGGDFGDWFSTGPHTAQVQDAFATPNVIPPLGVELTALDVVGYDLAAVPEPASLSLLVGGILALIGYRRLRRRSHGAAAA